MIHYLNHNGLYSSPDCLQQTPEGCYISTDPRLMDAPRAIRTRLDKPSQVMGINDQNRYKERSLLNYDASGFGYAGGYPNNAEITYYYDEFIADPFFRPNFIRAGGPHIWAEKYKDPMDSCKPHYYFTMSCPQQVSRLSWINDSTFFRQDLMALQMAKINQSRMENFL